MPRHSPRHAPHQSEPFSSTPDANSPVPSATTPVPAVHPVALSLPYQPPLSSMAQSHQPSQQQHTHQMLHGLHHTAQTDPVAHIVGSLVATAADMGFSVDNVSLLTPARSASSSSGPQWPAVSVNGTTHSPSAPPHPQYAAHWAVAAAAHAYPLQQTHFAAPVHQFYNHPTYFAAAASANHSQMQPNMFWSTVMPNPHMHRSDHIPPPGSSVAPGSAPTGSDRDLIGSTVAASNVPFADAVQASASYTTGANGAATAGPSPTARPTQTKEYVCPRCNASFKTNSNMQKHVRTVHENCRPFKCDRCDASYGHKNLLVEHVRTAHNGERPFVCDTCGARFGRSSNLYSHMKSHDGRREHQCKTCHVSFSLHGNMVKHIKTVHLKQRPFVCDVCSSRFGLRSDLMRHKRNVHGVVDKDVKSALGGRTYGSRTGVSQPKVVEKEIKDGEPDGPDDPGESEDG